MGIMVIAVFKPLPGKEAELDEVTRGHVARLRSLGLATDRSALAMRAADGSIVEVFEWASKEAIERAHADPEVLAMWKEYEACSVYRKYADLPEASEMFPGFQPFEL